MHVLKCERMVREDKCYPTHLGSNITCVMFHYSQGNSSRGYEPLEISHSCLSKFEGKDSIYGMLTKYVMYTYIL